MKYLSVKVQIFRNAGLNMLTKEIKKLKKHSKKL